MIDGTGGRRRYSVDRRHTVTVGSRRECLRGYIRVVDHGIGFRIVDVNSVGAGINTIHVDSGQRLLTQSPRFIVIVNSGGGLVIGR